MAETTGWLTSLFERRATKGPGWKVGMAPPEGALLGVSTETVAGVNVTPESALQITAVFSAIRVLSESVAMLPLILYRRLEPRGKARATEHALYSLLHDAPNPEMTAFDFRDTLMGHLCGWGNAYAEIEYNRGGKITALWPLRPDRMRVERKKGKLIYSYDLPDKFGTTVDLDMERVFHVRGLGSNGIVGYSPIYLARQALGLTQALEDHGGRFFGNGARPGTVLETPSKLSDQAYARLKSDWEKRHGGLTNAFRTAILEEGLKLHEFGIPNDDAQFLETRKFQVTEVARLYRVPPHKIMDLSQATFSNIEHQGIEFVSDSLMPWLVRWEQHTGRSLLTEQERRELFAQFLVDGLLRGDTASRYQAYATARQWGWYSANDVREKENENPVEGGDVYLVPMNMVAADQVSGEQAESEQGRSLTPGQTLTPGPSPYEGRGETRKAGGTRQRLMKAYKRVLRDTGARVVRREVNDVGNAARKWFGQRDYGQFSIWLDEFYHEHEEFVRKNFLPVADSYAEAVSGDAAEEVGLDVQPSDEDAVRAFVYRYVEALASRHCIANAERLRLVARRAIDAGEEPLAALETELERWPEAKSEELAQEEATRLNNAVAKVIYTLAGVQKLRSLAFGESCPYCQALDGKVVGINQWFLTAGEDFLPEGAEGPLRPSRNLGHAPYHGGCDCLVMASL